MKKALLVLTAIVGVAAFACAGGFYALFYLADGGTGKTSADRDVRNRGFKADQKTDLAGALTISVPLGFRLNGGARPQFPGQPAHAQFFLSLGAYTDFVGHRESGTMTIRAFPPGTHKDFSSLYPLNPGKNPEESYWETVRTDSPSRLVYRRVKSLKELRSFAAVDSERGFAVEFSALKDLYTDDQCIGIVTDALQSVEVRQPAFDQLLARMKAEYEEAIRFKQKNRADVEARIGPIPADVEKAVTTPKGDVLGHPTEFDDLHVGIRLAQLPATDPEAEAKRFMLDEIRFKSLTTEPPDAADKRSNDDVVAVVCFRDKTGKLQAIRLEPGSETHYIYAEGWGKGFQAEILAGTPPGSIVFWRFRVVNLRRNPDRFAAWITDSESYRKAARDGSPIWKPKVPGT